MNDLKGYRGNKAFPKAYQEIVNLIPPHKIYVEPYCGSAGIYRHKKTTLKSFLNDLDPTVASVWNDNVMAHTVVTNLEAKESIQLVLDNCLQGVRKFFYLDPPYPKSSRRSSKDIYNFEMSDNDHIQLLKYLLQISSDANKIMISTYENEIYNKYLKDWSKYTFKTCVHGKVAEEVLFFNYGYPTELHDYQYLGKDCWERQRINRKVSRIVKKLSGLPALERNKIINAVNNIQIK